MFKALSVNALLKSVIAGLTGVIIVLLSLGAWNSWTRLTVATRIAAVTDASGALFKALHNLRLDRTGTYRDLVADQKLTAINPQVRANREAEMPALRAAVEALKSVDLPDRAAIVAEWSAAVDRLAVLQKESADAMLKPKAERPPSLAQDYYKHATWLMENGDALSTRLSRYVKLQEPLVDQLLGLKQLAWDLRNAGGDASLLISGPLGGQAMQADPLGKLAETTSRMDTTWKTLVNAAAGLPLPPAFAAAMDKVKNDLFARSYIELRAKVVRELAETGKTNYTAVTWLAESTPRLATALEVAEIALDAANEHADVQRVQALRSLAWQGGVLAVAVILALVMMVVVSRHVTSPLHTIKGAMLKLAGGDLSTEVLFAGRKDEIGQLAGAMQVFKDSMIAGEQMRAAQKESEARAAAERREAREREAARQKEADEKAALERKAMMTRLADDFEAAIRSVVTGVSSAASQLETTAGTLTRTAGATQHLTTSVASASEEASGNVHAVASATEEMTASVSEIAKQVGDSSRIAGEAVRQAEQTDARISELSRAAARIGDVIKLITAIAEQTNLLALNATIEAARAGDAGKGFAVVAQEVKALAAQTAKATEEIGAQIAGMQTATKDSVAAIQEIGGTIGRISQIASAIAGAVQEQGAVTQEIARNVHEAAKGTTEVAGNIANVNRGASETGSASAQVLASATSLTRESRRLNDEVDKFLRTVRAG